MVDLKVVTISPAKRLSELDTTACDLLCQVIGAAVPGMFWEPLTCDGDQYVIFTSREREHWSFYLKRKANGWYVERQPDDETVVLITEGHQTPRAALGAAAYWVRALMGRMVGKAEGLMGWWWESHRTVVDPDELEPAALAT